MSKSRIAGVTFLALVAWSLMMGREEVSPRRDTVKIYYMGNYQVEDAMEDVINAFEHRSQERHRINPEEPEYEIVTGQDASKGPSEDPTRFLLSVIGENAPEVMKLSRNSIAQWAEKNVLHDLSEQIREDQTFDSKDFYPFSWEEAQYQPSNRDRVGIYGIPIDVDSRALLYNKRLLKASGFVDEKGEARPPRTWSELREMSLAMTVRDSSLRITQLGFVGFSTNSKFANSWLYLYSFLNGGEIIKPGSDRTQFSAPETVYALDWLTALYHDLGGAQEVFAFQSNFQAETLDPFVLENVAMKIDAYWTLPVVLTQYGADLDYGVAAPPLPDHRANAGAEPVTWGGGFAYCIPEGAKNKKGAWEFIRYMTSEEGEFIFEESQRQSVLNRGQIFVPFAFSANRKTNEKLIEKYVTSNPDLPEKVVKAVMAFKDLLDHAKIRPISPAGQFIWEQQITATEAALYQKSTPKKALEEADLRCNRVIEKIKHPDQGADVNWRSILGSYLGTIVLTVLLAGKFIPRYFQKLRKEIKGSLIHEPLLNGRDGLLFALPWILGFLVFTGGAIFYSFLMSFMSFDYLNPAKWIGFKNFEWMLVNDDLFWTSLVNTFFMILGVPLGLGLSLAMAIMLNSTLRGTALWRAIFFLPSIIPVVASSLLWIWILNPSHGLLNGMLSILGIDGPNWLQDPSTSKIALLLMGLWTSGGGIVIWLAGLKNINSTYYEAAEIDGAGRVMQFIHVTLPLLSPYIYFNLIMGLIGVFQLFSQAFIMTQGGPVHSTLFFAYHIFNQAFRFMEMGYASALSWVLVAIVLTFTWIQQKYSKKWVHYEGE